MANKFNKPLTKKQESASQSVAAIYPPIPQADEKSQLKYFTFSFRYFSERDYFGIGDSTPSRFKNLYERLSDLSTKTGAILEDYTARETYRLHPIDWEARACPIKIDDLDWIPQNIRKEAGKDFFWQFQLSKGTGRVVGFFNEEHNIFYIVLLDFKHNIQPSKDYGYAVNKTELAMTDYDKIHAHIIDLEGKRIKCPAKEQCPIHDLNMHLSTEAVFVNIDPELANVYQNLLRDGIFTEKFNNFLLENL